MNLYYKTSKSNTPSPPTQTPTPQNLNINKCKPSVIPTLKKKKKKQATSLAPVVVRVLNADEAVVTGHRQQCLVAAVGCFSNELGLKFAVVWVLHALTYRDLMLRVGLML